MTAFIIKYNAENLVFLFISMMFYAIFCIYLNLLPDRALYSTLGASVRIFIHTFYFIFCFLIGAYFRYIVAWTHFILYTYNVHDPKK